MQELIDAVQDNKTSDRPVWDIRTHPEAPSAAPAAAAATAAPAASPLPVAQPFPSMPPGTKRPAA
jgi:hypothetical protein